MFCIPAFLLSWNGFLWFFWSLYGKRVLRVHADYIHYSKMLFKFFGVNLQNFNEYSMVINDYEDKVREKFNQTLWIGVPCNKIN